MQILGPNWMPMTAILSKKKGRQKKIKLQGDELLSVIKTLKIELLRARFYFRRIFSNNSSAFLSLLITVIPFSLTCGM